MRHERFDYLMNLTNTRNSDMGRAMSFDSSYIGKIRRGTRKPPKNSDFIKNASEYLAKKVTEGYQRDALSDLLCPGAPLPEEAEAVAKLLEGFLSESIDDNNEQIKSFLSAFSPPTGQKAAKNPAPAVQQEDRGGDAVSKEQPAFHFGNEGKREAVLYFLSEAAKCKDCSTLLLYSDESMEWLYENNEFAGKWAALLIAFISRGGKIRIIHTISRNTKELLEAVQKWVPLYQSGAVEPFYYPLKRDGIYRRSLFVMPGHLALTSVSVGENSDGMANILTSDTKAVDAFEREFSNYHRLCQPLMHIHRDPDPDTFFKRICDFTMSGGEAYVAEPYGENLFSFPGMDAGSIERANAAFRQKLGSGKDLHLIRADHIPDGVVLAVKKSGGAMIISSSHTPVIYEMDQNSISEAISKFITRK